MLKPIDGGAAARPQIKPLAPEVVGNIFKVLHGFYGNLFLSKWATGQVDANGEDQGVNSARSVWAHGLRSFDAATVKGALAQCLERHPEFPPNLPQFVQLCMANRPREAFKPGHPALTMSSELRSRYTEAARAKLAKLRDQATYRKTGYIELPPTLDGLKRAIANAVSLAGGDEAATLRRLDVDLAARARA